MTFSIGLDIGGTKVAGIVIDAAGLEYGRVTYPTPDTYDDFLSLCLKIVTELKLKSSPMSTIGIGLPGVIDKSTGVTPYVSNIPYLSGKPLWKDLSSIMNARIVMANDAGCAALSEAMDGAGAADTVVFTAVLGTGVGGGLVINRQIIEGANSIAGEIGHLPLPFREAEDGPLVQCNCGQTGCIDKTASGSGLERLYKSMGGHDLSAIQIADRARDQEDLAARVLDQFYTVISKAMVTIIHSYDPGVIILSGGLSVLPDLVQIVSERYVRYCLLKDMKTRIQLAKHGSMTGLRGAAWLGATLVSPNIL